MSTELSVKAVAESVGISKQGVRKLCRDGIFKGRRVGRSWLVNAKSLTRYEANGRRSHRPVSDRPTQKTRSNKPIALSFFSGAMGLDQGIETAGFDIRLVCEIDKHCRETIDLNRPKIGLIGNINDYSAADVLRFAGLTQDDDVDLIFGGPPCQAFSTAGKRNGFNDDRGNVFLKYLEIAFDIRPKFVVIENVRGLLSSPMVHRPHLMRGRDFPDLRFDELPGGALNFVLSLVRRAGYQFSFDLYNAANFGTPQIRERVVIVCSRDGDKPPYLVPTHSEFGTQGLKKWRTFREVTRGIRKHHHLHFPEKRLKYYKMLSEGQHWRNLPEELHQEALGNAYFAGGGRTGFLRRLYWDRPSYTLVTHPAMPATDLAHPEKDRPLSIEEYKRLQEFDDKWKLAGSLTEKYKQVGNAVPASLGLAIGKLIKKLLNGTRIQEAPVGFQFSRYKNTSDTDWLRAFRMRSSQAKEVEQVKLFT